MGKASKETIRETANETRKELLHLMAMELEYNAVSLLNVLDKSGQNLKLAVRALAMKSESLLNDDPVNAKELPYFATEFDAPGKGPSDITEYQGYARQTRSGKTKPIKISFAHSSAHLPLDVDLSEVKSDLYLLKRLTTSFRGLYSELGEAPAWLNVGLESGVLMTYPGHGNFPHMYDHREQEWYRFAMWADEVTWSLQVDPATRAIVTTASFPIRKSDGTFLGAVSADVPTFAMMPDEELEERWGGEIKTLLVTRDPAGDDDGKGLPILAQQESDTGGRRHWMSGVEQEWLRVEDPVGYQVLLNAIDTMKSGVVKYTYNGEPSLCAFATEKNKGYSFMVIAPKHVVAQLPDAVAGMMSQQFEYIRDIASVVSGVMFILTGLIAWFGSRAITKPLLSMTHVAGRLAKGDFSARIDKRMGDERDRLVDSLNEMGPKLKELMQLNKDMELAEEVQRLLLPHSEPSLSGFDIAGGITYCDQTGGDYYDFVNALNHDGIGLGVVLGDVSGHGVPSALVMAAARGQLHTLSNIPMSAHERIQSINDVLSRDLFGTGRFLTMFYLRLEENSSRVKWVRAGHDPAILYNPSTEEFGELNGEGIPLGVMEEYQFESYEAELEDDELLVMATDGVWEARNNDGEMFGKERMLAIIKESAHKSAETIRLAIVDGVMDYCGGEQEDDIAVVVVRKISNSRQTMTRETISFRMTNKDNCFKCFQPRVEDFGMSHGLHPKIVFHLTLVLDELVTNIISYGYADYDEHPIDVTIAIDGDLLTIRVEDDSEPFNILEAPEPELDVPLEERDKPVGGMGIHLVKNMVHNIEYEREEGKNVLTLTKNISKTQCPVNG